MDAISLSCCWEATLLCPPFCCLIQPAEVGALPWIVCVSAPQKRQLYLGTVSALQLRLQVKGAFILPHQGQGLAPALLLAAGCSGAPQGDVSAQLQALFTAFQGEPFLLSSRAPELVGSGVCELARAHSSCPTSSA